MTTQRPRVEDWHKLGCRLFWVYEGPVQPRFQHGAYRQEGIVAWLILKGSVRLTFAHGSEQCGSGHWYFPRGARWTQDFSPDAEIISVRFGAHWPDSSPLFDRSRSLRIPMAGAPRLTSLARRLARQARKKHLDDFRGFQQIPRSLDDFLDMQRLFLSWLVAYVEVMRSASIPASAYRSMDERVSNAIAIMERADLHEPLREAELARIAGLSKSHLNRLFVIHTGRTPADHWMERRVRAARSALQESRRSVKSIAFELGFGSLSHFSTWLRKKTGRSPRELRRAAPASGATPENPHLKTGKTGRPRGR